MPSKPVPLVTDQYYHIYNRGTEKRPIFTTKRELNRFLLSLQLFNTLEPIQSIHNFRYREQSSTKPATDDNLVDIIAYCLNPNHYHLLLRQARDGGISEFMKRVNGGYTCYFNENHQRSGVLFQGKYKRIRVDTDGYLLHLSVYINLNNLAHRYNERQMKLTKSSWDQYQNAANLRKCPLLRGTDIILEQFANHQEYIKYAMRTLPEIQKKKNRDRELHRALLE